MQRVGGLFAGRAAPSSAPVPVSEPAPAPKAAPAATRVPIADQESVPAGAPSQAIELQQPFFEWVIGAGPALPTPMDGREHQLLASLDAVLASPQACSALLPRAPAVIPQLLNSLRDESQSTDALAQRVMRDPHLVAEVIRMANSAQSRASEPIGDIAEAIGRLGTHGLRRAIMRVVIKPMFVGSADTLSARCAPRLWQHSDAKAAACQQEASTRGLDPFEGYLVGLMHNIGWTAALRALDSSEGGAPSRFSESFVAALEPQRNTFFAMLIKIWQLTPGLTALGDELMDNGLAGARSPLGEALRVAEERASWEMLCAGGPGDAGHAASRAC